MDLGNKRDANGKIDGSAILSIYIEHDAVDLKQLKIPKNVKLITANAVRYREEHKAEFEVIDKFIRTYNSRLEQPATPETAEKK